MAYGSNSEPYNNSESIIERNAFDCVLVETADRAQLHIDDPCVRSQRGPAERSEHTGRHEACWLHVELGHSVHSCAHCSLIHSAQLGPPDSHSPSLIPSLIQIILFSIIPLFCSLDSTRPSPFHLAFDFFWSLFFQVDNTETFFSVLGFSLKCSFPSLDLQSLII